MSIPDPLYLSAESANALMVMLDSEIRTNEDIFTGRNEPTDYIFLGRKMIAYGEYCAWYEQQDCSDLLEDKVNAKV
tara:strand:+ start:216 stop:443 length:228 start_codon:yes stop_codon:yes gene_type:complete